jgi:hypothetical protein
VWIKDVIHLRQTLSPRKSGILFDIGQGLCWKRTQIFATEFNNPERFRWHTFCFCTICGWSTKMFLCKKFVVLLIVVLIVLIMFFAPI